MKKHFKFLMLALLTLMPFTLSSCGGNDDSDNNPPSSNTIQINGKSFEIDANVVQEGSFDAEDGKGEFTVSVFNQVGNTLKSATYRV